MYSTTVGGGTGERDVFLGVGLVRRNVVRVVL